MAIFPQQFFTQDNVLVRTGPPELREKYASSPIARKFAGPPKGVYQGFTPVAVGAVLHLNTDPGEGFSLLKVHSNVDPAGMDILVASNITIDFSTAANPDFQPDGVQVIARASYVEDQPTTAIVAPRTKTTTGTFATIGGTPAAFDLSTLQLDPILAGALSIAVNVQGFGPATITDDGNGNLVGATALAGVGTVDYDTGKLTGTTVLLTAASTVDITYTRGVGEDEVLICELTNASTNAAIVVDAVPGTTQDTPLAFPTDPFGFMPAGSVESLAAAVDILNEVVAARLDLQGVTHPSLKERLDTDLSAAAMAFRLGHVLRLLRSNDYAALSGQLELIVSGSLTETGRTSAPTITMNGGGTETVVGAITDPPDASRNVCFVVNSVTGERIIADPTTREVVFGRLKQDVDFLLDGTLTFTNALTTLSGSGSHFVAQLRVGDTVLGPDGKFYEIAAIGNDTNATLRVAYLGSTATSGGLLRRRFRLRFRKFDSGAEVDHALAASVGIRFFFPAFITSAQPDFDAKVAMYAPGERPAVPDASTTIPGKVALANAGSPFIGSINLQVGGVPVAGGPYHTLNFTGSPGSLSELSPGIVDAANVGGIGPVGPGSGFGPTGNPGLPGPNLTHITPFSVKASPDALGPTGPTNVSHTVDFGYQVRFLSGGQSRIKVPGPGGLFNAGHDFCTITDIRLDAATVGTITGTGGPTTVAASVVLYLDAAGA